MAENKKVLITGGTRGIGKAIVEEFASNPSYSHIAFVYASSDDKAKALVEELKSTGKEILAFKTDASSFEDVQSVVANAIEKMGGLDVLVNNAGITKDNLLLRMSEKDFDDVINVNLKSVFNFSKAVLRTMIKQRKGRIINISSVVGIIGNPGQANYVASKAGVIGFTKSLAKEVASRNITVNAVAPGYISTDMTDNLTDEQKEVLIKNIPLGRVGSTADIAKTVKFLSSEDAGYITGQVIVVDGGLAM